MSWNFTVSPEEMVEKQLVDRGITDARVLEAFRTVPRHRFIPRHLRAQAYEDRPIPLGDQETVSQPYIVALSLQELAIAPTDAVLEVGSGSGFVLALLSELARSVAGIEYDDVLVRRSRRVLKRLGYLKVRVYCGDGLTGLPEQAPFDKILCSAACTELPRLLVKQLSPDSGKLVFPMYSGDEGEQELIKLTKVKTALQEQYLGRVRFVDMKTA